MLRRLSGVTGGGAAQLVRVSLDPRRLQARATIYADLRDRAAATDPRSILMREGYRLARAVQLAEPSLESVEVFIVGPTGIGAEVRRTDLLLVGALARGDLVAAADRLSEGELDAYYNNGPAPPFWGTEPALD